MAIQTFPGGVYFPRYPQAVSNTVSLAATLIIDAADEGAAFMISAPKTGSIRKIHWATRTVTTGATLDVRIETITATSTPAIPSGTLWGTNTNGSQVINAADDNVWITTTLTADASVTQGDHIAVVIKQPNASFGSMQISVLVDDGTAAGYPYTLLNTGTSPSVSWALFNGNPIVVLEYSDGSVAPTDGCWPIRGTATSTALSTSTTPDSIGVRFQLPYSANVSGIWLWADTDGDFAARLVTTAYHQANATGILASCSHDTDLRVANLGGLMLLRFTSTVTLSANTYYRCLIEPTSATALNFYDFDVSTLALLDAYAGQDFHLTTAKDPTQDSDWTNYNSGTFRVPFMGLQIAGIDTGGSGGVSGSRIFGGF